MPRTLDRFHWKREPDLPGYYRHGWFIVSEGHPNHRRFLLYRLHATRAPKLHAVFSSPGEAKWEAAMVDKSEAQ